MAVVVAQLAEQWLPISEVHRSNPVIGKICIKNILLVNSRKDKIKAKKKPGMANFLKKRSVISNLLQMQSKRLIK